MKNLIEVKNVHKSFNENQVHKGITLSLKEGECLGLLGYSGTGKSVLLKSIIGLDLIDEGEIRFLNQRIDQLSEDEYFKIRTKISYAFQYGALFDSMSVYDNLAYPLKEHTSLTEEEISILITDSLSLVGLPDKEHLMPAELSGGMRKRVGLARATILKPQVILYDEPTAGLDPKNIENIVKIMITLKNQESSSIFVTHDIPAAMQVCDRIIILGDGKVQFEGTPAQMKNSQESFVKDFFAMEGKYETK